MDSQSPDIQAAILTQALPYIRAFHGKTIVIKYGGNAMIDEDLKRAVVRDVLLMRYVGINPILVHGGGPEVSDAMRRMGKEPEFVGGLRVTDAETMEIVEMVLTGKTNKNIVALLNAEGGQEFGSGLAVGLSGKDANLLQAVQETGRGDIGFVGRINKTNPAILHTLAGAGYIPVVSSVAIGADGQSYNVNADTAAAAIAVAVGAAKLILLTDVEGLYRDFADKDSLISEITAAEARELLATGTLEAGMIPKLEACAEAVEDGVPRAHIIDGRRAHSLLIEVFTESGIGTMVVPAETGYRPLLV
ncbi:MAG: acetylglutamate kinase [Armatimonadetes bacterium]|nr:acetylglutamate kinase [Armatimonadota bacterium]